MDECANMCGSSGCVCVYRWCEDVLSVSVGVNVCVHVRIYGG